jgi:hypothetical protein
MVVRIFESERVYVLLFQQLTWIAAATAQQILEPSPVATLDFSLRRQTFE